MKAIVHQFTLFDYNQMRPRAKVPISKERIEAAKKLLMSGDQHSAAIKLREVIEALENYEQRITHGQAPQND